MEKRGKDETRREFLRTGARRLALGALGISGGALALRKPTGQQIEHTCINQGICRGCRAFSACALPQALSAKNATVQEKGRTNDE